MKEAPLTTQDVGELIRGIEGVPRAENAEAMLVWGIAYMVSRITGATMPSRPPMLSAAEASRVASLVDRTLEQKGICPAKKRESRD